MQAIFNHSHDEAANISSFFFKPEKPLAYTAGQFIELNVPHNDPDKRGEKRWFTVSSSPNDELISITTKFAAQDGSSFKHALRRLSPGNPVSISDPMGDFVLPKLIQTPLLFVAAGIGITPFHSILSWLAQTDEKRPIQLIHGVSSEDEIIFQETFEKANQHATIVVSDPTPAWGGNRGHLSAELITGLAEPSDDTLIYVSGPETFVEQLKKDLQQQGIDRHQIVVDAFPNYRTI